MKGTFDKILTLLPERHRKLVSVYVTFLVFLIANCIMDPAILTSYRRLWPLSLQFAPLMLCAMSQTTSMLTGGINLSIGTGLSLMTVIAAVTMKDGVFGILGSVVLVILCGMAMGGIMGAVIVIGRLPDIIVTLAFSYIWHGIALYILPIPGGNIPYSYVKLMGNGPLFPLAIVVVCLSLVVWKLIKNTRVGLNIYAVGGNPSAAYGNGINIKKTRVISYVIGGAFLAVAGLILVGQTGSGDANLASTYSMNSIAAAVLGGVGFTGGVGTMHGAVMGSFIFTSLVNILFFSGLSPFYQYIVQGGILIVAIGVKAIHYYRKGGDRA